MSSMAHKMLPSKQLPFVGCTTKRLIKEISNKISIILLL
nr:MAG TPA: hypothetical protein [Caudoviricetes sp.]